MDLKLQGIKLSNYPLEVCVGPKGEVIHSFRIELTKLKNNVMDD